MLTSRHFAWSYPISTASSEARSRPRVPVAALLAPRRAQIPSALRTSSLRERVGEQVKSAPGLFADPSGEGLPYFRAGRGDSEGNRRVVCLCIESNCRKSFSTCSRIRFWLQIFCRHPYF